MECTKCEKDNYNFLQPSLYKKDIYGNALECECEANRISIENMCSHEEMRRGNCQPYSCSSYCYEQSLAVSLDGKICVSCEAIKEDEVTNTNYGSLYDFEIRDCNCQNPNKLKSSGHQVSTRRLVEVYDEDSGMATYKICLPCPYGTAVITRDLYSDGNQFLFTAGEKYVADAYFCAPCPDLNMFFDTDYTCRCTDGYLMVGESSIGKLSCIKYTPTISSAHTKVEFHNAKIIQQSISISKTTVHSIIFSHYYLKSASMCEFLEGLNSDSQRACQTLGNLCVLNSYREESDACRQFQQIISRARDTNYHTQEDWKINMPWLYYEDEADDITYDRGIEMRVAFSEVKGRTHNLKFKIAKYALNGTFVALEDLSTQFMFCHNLNNQKFPSDDEVKNMYRFGNNYRYEFECSIKKLLSMEMFFYDMYIVDTDKKCSNNFEINEGDCLYPVPVLNRNFVKDDSFPNMNFEPKDEHNDRLVRRFFLFDNEVSKTTAKVHRHTTLINENNAVSFFRYHSLVNLNRDWKF